MAPSNPLHDPLCECGSCNEAFDAALKTMEQLLTHQCPAWFIAVTRAQWRVAEMMLELNADAAPYFLRFEEHLTNNNDVYGKRVMEMLKRAGLEVTIVDTDGPREGDSIN